MRAVDLIRKKRDGRALTSSEVAWLINAYTAGEVGDEQMAAFAMAVFFRGMGGAELSALTEAMMRSGQLLDLSPIPGIKVDKHSTGGVGDKISICLAPLVAACGVPVPMISGRSLGHTGGTLDKLAAIPGFRTDLDAAAFARGIEKLGLALIGQTDTLAPADKKLYALRDVTATVESIPLIVASILSKKLAEGIDALLLDVKVGSGAFMKSAEDARALARTLVSVGTRLSREVRAVITSMDQVLGRAVGNAVETWEAIEVLKGGGPEDVVELTAELGAEMLVLGRVAESLDDGRTRIRRAMRDGRGLERFRRVIEAQGGDPGALDTREKLGVARHQRAVELTGEGFVVGFDVEAIGRAAMLLGAGRARASDPIDLTVGLEMALRIGDRVDGQALIATLLYNDDARVAEAEAAIRQAVRLGPSAVPTPLLIRERITREGKES